MTSEANADAKAAAARIAGSVHKTEVGMMLMLGVVLMLGVLLG